MATSQILINGSSSAVISLSIGSSVTLANSDNTGVTSWQWSFIDRPSGSSATLSTPTASTSGFTVDREGSYLISLIVNGTVSGTSIASALTSLSSLRLPAALERLEVNTSRGWAESLNINQIQFERESRAGNILTCRSTAALAIGIPVRINGTATLLDGTIVPTVIAASASADTTLPVIGITASSAGASGITVRVRTAGIFSEGTLNTLAAAVNDPVYVSNAGTLSLSAGTVSHIVARVATINASGRIVVTPNHTPTSGGGGGGGFDSRPYLADIEADGFISGGSQTVSTSNVVVAAYTLVSNGDLYTAGGATTVPIPDGSQQYVYFDGTSHTLQVGTEVNALYTSGNVPICYIFDVTAGVISGYDAPQLVDVRRFVNKGANKVVLTIGAAEPTGTNLGHADFYDLQGAVNWAVGARLAGFWKMIEFRIVDTITLSQFVDFKNLTNAKFASTRVKSDITTGALGPVSPSIIITTSEDIFYLNGNNNNLSFEGLHFVINSSALRVPSIFYIGDSVGIDILGCSTEPSFDVTLANRLSLDAFINTTGAVRSMRIENNFIYTSDSGIIGNISDSLIINNSIINNGKPHVSGGQGYRGIAVNDNVRIENNDFTYTDLETGFRETIVAGDNTTILNNTINYDGTLATSHIDVRMITVSNISNILIQGNTIVMNSTVLNLNQRAHAIDMSHASNIDILNNTIINSCVTNTTVANRSVDIKAEFTSNVNIDGNDIQHTDAIGYCVWTFNGDGDPQFNVNVNNNRLKMSTSATVNAAIQSGVGNSTISGNTIRTVGSSSCDSTHGIGITGGDVLVGNIMFNVARGIITTGDNTVSANKIQGVILIGIETGGANNVINGNLITSSNATFTHGIKLSIGSSDTIISNNRIIDDFAGVALGIDLAGAADLVVTGNRIARADTGIDAGLGSGILIGNNTNGCGTNIINAGTMTTTGNI